MPTKPNINPAPSGEPRRTSFIMVEGRGNGGKTYTVRWIVGRALNAGRPAPIIADADVSNRTLAAYFPGLVSEPPNADPLVLAKWSEDLLEQALRQRRDIIFDFGPASQVFRRLALELGMEEFLLQHGCDPTVLHLLNTEVESLSALSTMEAGGLFAPARTALVLNDGVVPAGMIEADAFAAVRAHPVFIAAVKRGAVPLSMPRCPTVAAGAVNSHFLPFHDAAANSVRDGQEPLSLVNAQRLNVWLRAMEAAFEKVREWLP